MAVLPSHLFFVNIEAGGNSISRVVVTVWIGELTIGDDWMMGDSVVSEAFGFCAGVNWVEDGV